VTELYRKRGTGMRRWFFFFLAICSCNALGAAGKPNIVYIMSDELAYFELSHMGN
ncbi:uncharacterized protein METZ01_LOCUS473439, partial [marine metagenome]